MRRISRCGAAALALAAVFLVAAPAAAQQGLPLSRFNPAPAGDRFFSIASPYAAGDPVAPHVLLLAEYAHNPLVVRRRNPDGSATDVGAVVDSQLILHLNGGVALFDRLNVNLDLPLVVFQQGTSVSAGGVNFVAPNSFALGDLRLGVRARLYGEYYDGFQLGIGGYMWFPTAEATRDQSQFVSDRNVRGMPQVYLGGLLDRFLWTANLGVDVRAEQRYPNSATVPGVSQSSMFNAGIGLGFRLGEERQFQLGPEATLAVDLVQPDTRNINFEALIGAKWRFIKDMEAGVAVGPGLSRGIGTPDVRVVASLAYTPYVAPPVVDRDKDGVPDKEDACPDVPGIRTQNPATNGCPPPPPDTDKDGILDSVDACLDVAGVPNEDPRKHGCPPPPDRDKDTILDDVDACADVPGVASQDPKKNGCPPDRDEDGIYDADDACPDLKGVKSEDKTKNGCPPDTDGDGFRDDQDACPREKGPDDPDPTKRGCPKSVRVTDKEVIILQQVQFDTGKSVIKKESDALLDEVAAVLKEHPELTLVEVQGHTDNRAARAYNLNLSEGRANAVKKALESRGLDAKRVVAKGYGMARPIAENKTEEGRTKNRRVQFIVLEKDGKPMPQDVPAPPPEAPKPEPKAPPPPQKGPAPAPKAPAPAKTPAKKK